jgi:predicted small metal-binding protein
MPKFLRCGDIFPGCTSVIRGGTTDEVVINLAQHARTLHDLREFTPEIMRRLRSAIHDEKASAA